jgi:hypothetical protein
MQVWLYVNRDCETKEAAYIGLYFVQALYSDGYVHGWKLNLHWSGDLAGEDQVVRVGEHTGRFVDMVTFMRNVDSFLVFDDGQEIKTLGKKVL